MRMLYIAGLLGSIACLWMLVFCLSILADSVDNTSACNESGILIIENITFDNNTKDNTSCYFMIDGKCMDTEMGLR